MGIEINARKMDELLSFYRKSFVEHWDEEKYKWQAVKHFQENWNIDAEDFGKMFELATEKTSNLLAAANFFPRGMIINFAKENREKTRQMFVSLFDENTDLILRYENFKKTAKELQEEHNATNQHQWNANYQKDNAISTYLWLRYPDKYYIYKYSEYRRVAEVLGCDIKFTKGEKENIKNGLALYNQLCECLNAEKKLRNLLKERVDESCYEDSTLKILTTDFGFHISRYFALKRNYWIVKVTDDDYWGKTIENNIWYSQQRYGYQSTNSVTNFLNQIKNVNKDDVFLLAYGNTIYAYGFVQDCNIETEQISSIDKLISEKSYEYTSGIVRFNDSEVFYENLENGEEGWGQRINVEKWLCYNSESEVITYGVKDSIASGIVSMSIYGVTKEYGENKMRELEKQKIENQSLAEKLEKLLKHTHNLILHGAPGTGKTHLAREIADGMGAEVGFVQFHPSYDYTDFVEGLRPINDGNGGQIGFERKDGVFKKFCKKVVKETVMDFLSSACNDKRNIKAYREEGYDNYKDQYTFSIKSINEDDNYIKIQPIGEIHGTLLREIDLKIPYLISLICSYKTIKTKGDVKTIFQDIPEHSELYYFTLLCEIKKAENKPFAFIIDEINRGEMSKIFGELFFSIDPGYRGTDGLVQTQYQNLVPEDDAFSEGFYVPENVYIIGTMNDIDRNVESMDFAFRRRFTFKEIKANDTQGQILSSLDDSIRQEAINRMDSLNKAIWDVENKTGIEGLSSSYHIGGAYFLKLKDLNNDFTQLWDCHLEGLLREYLRGMEDSETKLEDLKKAYNLEA